MKNKDHIVNHLLVFGLISLMLIVTYGMRNEECRPWLSPPVCPVPDPEAVPVDNDKMLQALLPYAEGESKYEARRALKRIGQLGADAKEALPRLEEIAKNHSDEMVRELARESIEEINSSDSDRMNKSN